eukprot:2992453-Prymnesium_polylepis.1
MGGLLWVLPQVGSLVWSTAESQQEYGYIMTTGVRTGGFLHKDKWSVPDAQPAAAAAAAAHPPRWRPT